MPTSRQMSRSQAHCRRKIRHLHGHADVWFALGNLYQWQGQPAKAAEAYGRAAALRPGDATTLAAHARALRATQPRPAPQPFIGSPEAAIAAGYTWVAGLTGTWQDVGAGPRWNDQTLSVRHYMKRGSIGFEALRTHRFDQAGRAWAIDVYASLWQGAHAKLRYQHAPGGRLLARWYYTGSADSYLEAAANRGRSDDPLSFSGGRARSGGGSLTWVHYLSRDWGARAGASMARSGAHGARERGITLGLQRRWQPKAMQGQRQLSPAKAGGATLPVADVPAR